MRRNEIDKFEKINSQLEGFYQDMLILTKKNPNDGVNKFKLTLLNQLLLLAKDILPKKYQPFEDFNGFNEEQIPSNSDVLFVITQYLNCLEKLRADNIHPRYDEWYWRIDDEDTNLRTAPPKKIK